MDIKPWKTTDADIVFGGTGKDVPTYEQCNKLHDEGKIPEKYCQLVSDWFFGGLTKLEVAPREGIDKDEAMRCIRAELSSWNRKHEHKTLLIAYLFEQWFSDVQWEKK